jgi:HK97 family phage major capsid protein
MANDWPRVEAVGRRLGVLRYAVVQYIKSGVLKTMRAGGATWVSHASVEQFAADAGLPDRPYDDDKTALAADDLIPAPIEHPVAPPAMPQQDRAMRQFGEALMLLARGWNRPGDGPDSIVPQVREIARAWTGGAGGASGGYLIKPEWVDLIWDKVRFYPSIALVRWFRTRSRETYIRIFNERSRADGSRYGGILAYWGSEELAPLPNIASLPALAQADFYLSRLIVYINGISRDLLADADLLPETLCTAVVNEFAFQIERAVLTGNGTAQPQGIVNASATVSVAKDGGQTSGTISTTNIDNMWKSLYGPCRRGAVWLANDDTAAALDEVASAANWPQSQYLPQGVSANPWPLIKGRPLLPAEACPQIGTPGDLILFDPTQYALMFHVMADRRPELELAIEVPARMTGVAADVMEARYSEYRLYDTDQVPFMFKMRGDGRPLWSSTMTNINGATVGMAATIQQR